MFTSAIRSGGRVVAVRGRLCTVWQLRAVRVQLRLNAPHGLPLLIPPHLRVTPRVICKEACPARDWATAIGAPEVAQVAVSEVLERHRW